VEAIVTTDTVSLPEKKFLFLLDQRCGVGAESNLSEGDQSIKRCDKNRDSTSFVTQTRETRSEESDGKSM
jgi:hypothetical protein